MQPQVSSLDLYRDATIIHWHLDPGDVGDIGSFEIPSHIRTKQVSASAVLDTAEEIPVDVSVKEGSWQVVSASGNRLEVDQLRKLQHMEDGRVIVKNTFGEQRQIGNFERAIMRPATIAVYGIPDADNLSHICLKQRTVDIFVAFQYAFSLTSDGRGHIKLNATIENRSDHEFDEIQANLHSSELMRNRIISMKRPFAQQYREADNLGIGTSLTMKRSIAHLPAFGSFTKTLELIDVKYTKNYIIEITDVFDIPETLYGVPRLNIKSKNNNEVSVYDFPFEVEMEGNVEMVSRFQNNQSLPIDVVLPKVDPRFRVAVSSKIERTETMLDVLLSATIKTPESTRLSILLPKTIVISEGLSGTRFRLQDGLDNPFEVRPNMGEIKLNAKYVV